MSRLEAIEDRLAHGVVVRRGNSGKTLEVRWPDASERDDLRWCLDRLREARALVDRELASGEDYVRVAEWRLWRKAVDA